jgi:tetratricopeptide (TPR) repeat protein
LGDAEPSEAPAAHEAAVAQWAFDHQRLAGVGTDTLPDAAYLYLPMMASQGVQGVIAVRPPQADVLLSPDYRDLLETVAASPPDGERLVAAMCAAVQLFYTGHRELASEFLLRLERDAQTLSEEDPVVAARLHQLYRAAQSVAAGDLWQRRRHGALVVESFRRAGDRRMECTQQLNLGYTDLALGRNQEALDALLGGLALAERLGLASSVALAKHNLGLALLRLGRLDEARAVEMEAVAALVSSGDRRMEGASRAYLATILSALHDLDAAEEQAREAIRVTDALGPIQAFSHAVLAQVLLSRGRNDDALHHARHAKERLAELGRADDGETVIHLTFAVALRAAGQEEAARAAILEAWSLVDVVAQRVPDGPVRASFLANVPENARIMELAREVSSARSAASVGGA